MVANSPPTGRSDSGHAAIGAALGVVSVGFDAEGGRGFFIDDVDGLSADCGARGKTGEQLIEPDGRRVRLTPAGQRLADHAVTILAAVDAARLDLNPDAEPVGTVRVGGFATGIRVSLLPIVRELAVTHRRVEVAVSEYEPLEAFDLLVDDDLDLAITYDYNLAPASPGPGFGRRPLCRRLVDWQIHRVADTARGARDGVY